MLNIDDLRFITRDGVGETAIFRASEKSDILKEISTDLGILPNIDPFDFHQVKLAICVEGKNDISFLKNINKSVSKLKRIIDLERKDIIFIPMGGSTLQFWVNEDYLGKLNLAQFHIYDSDIGSKVERKYTKYIEIINTKEKSFGVETKMREFENYVPYKTLENYYESLVLSDIEAWDTSDIPELVAKHVHHSDDSRACEWDALTDEKKKKKIGKIKNRFNAEHILETEESDLIECGFLEEIESWHFEMAKLLV